MASGSARATGLLAADGRGAVAAALPSFHRSILLKPSPSPPLPSTPVFGSLLLEGAGGGEGEGGLFFFGALATLLLEEALASGGAPLGAKYEDMSPFFLDPPFADDDEEEEGAIAANGPQASPRRWMEKSENEAREVRCWSPTSKFLKQRA